MYIMHLSCNTVLEQHYISVVKDHTYALPYPSSPPPLLVLDINDVSCNTTVETSLGGPDDNWEGSVTRCICGFQHDDGFMICCDRCWWVYIYNILLEYSFSDALTAHQWWMNPNRSWDLNRDLDTLCHLFQSIKIHFQWSHFDLRFDLKCLQFDFNGI